MVDFHITPNTTYPSVIGLAEKAEEMSDSTFIVLLLCPGNVISLFTSVFSCFLTKI